MSAPKSIEPAPAPGPHLSLVFNESGEDPLVLASWWTGCGNRAHPELFDVKQAKPTVRALSILFLLAKSQEPLHSPRDNPIRFRVNIRNRTWICTLANKPNALRLWVKRQFHITPDHLFLEVGAGSVQNKNGRVFASVEFWPHRLPLANLQLFVQKEGALNEETRPLRPEEFIPFALKLERMYPNWNNSAIQAWLSNGQGVIKVPSVIQKNNGQQLRDDDLFAACLADTTEQGESETEEKWKFHFNLMFRVLLEKEFDRYRENCRPFFSFVGNSLQPGKLPFLWEGYAWNPRQVELLRDNCTYYAYFSYKSVKELRRDFPGSNWDKIEDADIVEHPFKIFDHLSDLSGMWSKVPACTKWVPNWDYSGEEAKLLPFDDSSPLILDEARESIRSLVSGLENKGRAFHCGTLFIQQIMLIDFLNEVCLPFYTPLEISERPGRRRSRERLALPLLIFYLKKEAAENRRIINQFCASRSDFLEAVQAGRSLLMAQSAFWNALHRRLLAVETGGSITG